MLNARQQNYFHLHVLVFIAGFTAILGKLITISAIPLVWFRMVLAIGFMFIYIKIYKLKLKINTRSLIKLSIAGIFIALHWVTFFASIKASNISIALAMFSVGAFFASFIEPIIYKRRIILYEIILGVLVFVGVIIITRGELKYLNGIILGLISAFFSALFAVLNGKFLSKHSATIISFYEFVSGILFLSVLLFFIEDGFSKQFFQININDFLWLFILASICTAYAFIASVYIMKYISPYTVVLTYNLEPIYGIILAFILFPKTESMSVYFYIGAGLILLTVLLNTWLKNKSNQKKM